MDKVKVDHELEMVYDLADCTDPWTKADTILLLHGGLKPRQLYYAWVPTLSRHLKVIRPYWRGHWGSSPAPEGYRWSIAGLVSELRGFMDALGLERVHLVGESIGGMVGYHFAYQYPERLKTLTVANCPGPTLKGHRMSLLSGLLRQKGIAAAVDHIATQHSDEKSDIPGLDDWIHAEMKKCPLDATLGMVEAAASVDINVEEFLRKIQVPTLILTGSEYTSLITLKEAQHFRDLIPKAKLVAFPGVKAAVVGAVPERCAAEVLRFISEQESIQLIRRMLKKWFRVLLSFASPFTRESLS